MLAEVLFYGIVIYLIYKIVFGLVLPVAQAGKQMKQQFRDFQENMQQPNNFQQQSPPRPNSSQSRETVGDYIDFEEVKK